MHHQDDESVADDEGQQDQKREVDRRTFIRQAGIFGGAVVLGATGSRRLLSTEGVVKRQAREGVTKRQASRSGGKITYAQSEATENTDPAYDILVYPSAEEVSLTIYDNLVTFDSKMGLVPQLATSWDVSPDKLTWTFHLRRGVTFADGTDFDADSLVTCAERDTNPLNTNDEWTTVFKKWKAVDPYTVELTTYTPFSGTLNYLAKYSGAITSPKTPKAKQSHPVGCGPYKVSKFEAGVQTTVVPFDAYWGGKPALDEITFRYVPDNETAMSMLETNEAQVMDNVSPTQAAALSGELRLLKKLTARSFFVEFNLLRPMFQDVRVRHALNYAVDSSGIIKSILNGYGEPMNSPASPTLPGYKAVGEYAYNPRKARELLSAAGWTPGSDGVLQKDGTRLAFNLTNGESQFPNGDVVCEAVQSNLNSIGCDVTIHEIPAASFFSALRVPPSKQTLDTVLFGFNPSNDQMEYLLSAMWQSNPTSKAVQVWNVSWYSNKLVDKWINGVNQSFSSTEQNTLYADIQKTIWDEAPAIWLYTPYQLSAVRKSVEGVYVEPIVYTMVRNAHLV